MSSLIKSIANGLVSSTVLPNEGEKSRAAMTSAVDTATAANGTIQAAVPITLKDPNSTYTKAFKAYRKEMIKADGAHGKLTLKGELTGYLLNILSDVAAEEAVSAESRKADLHARKVDLGLIN